MRFSLVRSTSYSSHQRVTRIVEYFFTFVKGDLIFLKQLIFYSIFSPQFSVKTANSHSHIPESE